MDDRMEYHGRSMCNTIIYLQWSLAFYFMLVSCLTNALFWWYNSFLRTCCLLLVLQRVTTATTSVMTISTASAGRWGHHITRSTITLSRIAHSVSLCLYGDLFCSLLLRIVCRIAFLRTVLDVRLFLMAFLNKAILRVKYYIKIEKAANGIDLT